MFFFFKGLLGLSQRRVQIETSLASRLRRMLLVLFSLLALHVAAMLIFEQDMLRSKATETHAIGDFEAFVNAIWVTMTTVITVGYGDFSAATIPGKFATMILLYTGAVFIVANVASAAVELRLNRVTRMREGTWRWNLRDHILLINSPAHDATRYFVQLLKLIRAERELRDTPVMILTEGFDGLPDEIKDLGAVYCKGSPHDLEALKRADAAEAKYVVLIAEQDTNPKSDSLNFDILLELHETYTGARIISEVVEDAARERFRRFGSHRIVRPARTYPEFIVRALTNPGSESVVEDMLNASAPTARRFNVRINNQLWAEVASALLKSGIGTPVGYVNDDRQVVSAPRPHDLISGRGVFVMIADEKHPTRGQVQDAIDSATAAAV